MQPETAEFLFTLTRVITAEPRCREIWWRVEAHMYKFCEEVQAWITVLKLGSRLLISTNEH
jgi:hypothetical protein